MKRCLFPSFLLFLRGVVSSQRIAFQRVIMEGVDRGLLE